MALVLLYKSERSRGGFECFWEHEDWTQDSVCVCVCYMYALVRSPRYGIRHVAANKKRRIRSRAHRNPNKKSQRKSYSGKEGIVMCGLYI